MKVKMIIKTLCLFSTCLLMLCACTPKKEYPVGNNIDGGFKLSVDIPKYTLAVGDKMTITATVHNLEDRERAVEGAGIYGDDSLIQVIPLSEIDKNRMSNLTGFGFNIKPLGKYEEAREFEAKEKGKYVILVSFHITAEDNKEDDERFSEKKDIKLDLGRIIIEVK